MSLNRRRSGTRSTHETMLRILLTSSLRKYELQVQIGERPQFLVGFEIAQTIECWAACIQGRSWGFILWIAGYHSFERIVHPSLNQLQVSMVNFSACQAAFLGNTTNLELYSYLGPVHIIQREELHFISTSGCKSLCGKVMEVYAWTDSADTILTWVLPMLVLFLLAPFEPNETKCNLLAAVRWLGSPFYSLWCILCNIRATGRCAELIDTASLFNTIPPEESRFGQFRDSMLILSMMNQYEMNPAIIEGHHGVAAEFLLWTVLFGQMSWSDSDRTLEQRRRKMATALRAKRRRGIVPILIGLFAFVFVLGLSIEFGKQVAFQTG